MMLFDPRLSVSPEIANSREDYLLMVGGSNHNSQVDYRHTTSIGPKSDGPGSRSEETDQPVLLPEV